MLVFQDRPQGELVQSNDSMETAKQPLLPLKTILKRRDVQFVTIACFCQGIVRDGISLWAAMFFMEAYGLDIKQAVLLMLLIPVANFASVIGIGWLYKKHPLGLERLAAMTFMAGAAMTGALFFLWHAGAVIAMVLLALASATMCAANTLLLGVYPLFFANEGRVSGMAGFLEFSAYLAAGCTAVLSGLLLDLMGWQSVLVLWLFVALIGALALFMAKRVQNKAIQCKSLDRANS
jgi:OPA family glycerol-3-phosphate transporter-like MFS transporter